MLPLNSDSHFHLGFLMMTAVRNRSASLLLESVKKWWCLELNPGTIHRYSFCLSWPAGWAFAFWLMGVSISHKQHPFVWCFPCHQEGRSSAAATLMLMVTTATHSVISLTHDTQLVKKNTHKSTHTTKRWSSLNSVYSITLWHQGLKKTTCEGAFSIYKSPGYQHPGI